MCVKLLKDLPFAKEEQSSDSVVWAVGQRGLLVYTRVVCASTRTQTDFAVG